MPKKKLVLPISVSRLSVKNRKIRMKKLIFFGLLSFSIAAIWQLPLSFVKPYIEKEVKGLKLTNPSGTVWNGKADTLRVAKTNIDGVDWQVKPLDSLTSLSLKVAFTVDDPNITAKGLASITPSQNIILDDTKFDLNATYLNTLQKHAKVAGEIKGNITRAEIYKDQNKLPKVNAIIDWKDGAINSPLKLAPGDYKAIITPQAGDTLIKISSFEAPMELTGEIKVNKTWDYNIALNIKSKDKNIGPLVGLLGKKQADGSIAVTKNGNLKSKEKGKEQSKKSSKPKKKTK